MRDPHRAIEVVALEVVSEAHDASIPSALVTLAGHDYTVRAVAFSPAIPPGAAFLR